MKDMDVEFKLPHRGRYKYCRNEVGISDGLKDCRGFEGLTELEALQKASDYWFNGDKVADYEYNHPVVTLFFENGSVIGKLIRR